MKSNISGKTKIRQILYVIALLPLVCLSLITDTADATLLPPPILADHNNNEGSFFISVFRDGEWQLQGELSFTDYETLQLPLSNDTGRLKLRLVQEGHDAAYVDQVILQKYGIDYLPAAATNIDDNIDVLAKILCPEYDVCNGWESTLEIVWDSAPQNATLIMRAMEEELGEGHGAPLYHPWPYEHRTLSNLLVNDGGITVDGLLNEHIEPNFSVFWQPDSPHPDGYTYGWIHCDNEYLYTAVEVTPDNTADEEDWGALYIMVDGKLKEFRISEDQTWGVRGFGYTSSVAYEHRIYEFKIPLSEINATVGSEIQYIFGAYGTAAVKLMNVYVNGTTGDDINYDGSSPTYISGSIGPKKTIEGGIGVVAANGTVNIAAGTYHEYGLDLLETMNLVGAGALTTIIDGTVDGNPQGFVLEVKSEPFQRNTISGFTIRNGAPAGSNAGGGIYISQAHIVTINDCAIINNVVGDGSGPLPQRGGGVCNDGGVLYMNRCTISGNTASLFGGGVFTQKTFGGDSGLAVLTNCTISGNQAGLIGGGIYCGPTATMRLVNVTIANNRATGGGSLGGGFANASPSSAYFKNCIVANNTAGDGIHNNGFDDFGGEAVFSLGYNIDSENSCYFIDATDQRNTNPLLGGLQNNGGQTSTHAITVNSPAFNRGTCDGAPTTDQRGITRPQGTNCDIGAFELELQQSAQVPTATGTGTATFTVSNCSITNLTASTSSPCGTLSGFSFPHGLFSFNITNIPIGATVTITITLPSDIPTDTQYWKCINGAWVNCTSLLGDNDGDNILTLTIKDGGLGDADGQADGKIVDPGAPVVPVQVAHVSSGTPATAPRRAPLKPAQMSVQYLSIDPQQTFANQPVTISTNVINSGDEAGNLNVILNINGQVEQTRMVSVGPQAAQQVKFTVTKSQPGTYSVDIGGQKGSFTIYDAVGGTSNSGANTGWIAALIIGVLIIATVVVLVLIFRRTS